MHREIEPGRWDTQIFRGTNLDLKWFSDVERVSQETRDGKRWIILHFTEGGRLELLSPRGFWIEPERH